MTLFTFLLAVAALVSLPTANFVALRPPFSFRQAQFVGVFPLKFAIALLFSSFFFISNPLAGTVFSPVLPGYNRSGHSFLPENDAANKLAWRGALLLQRLVSLFLLLVFLLLGPEAHSLI